MECPKCEKLYSNEESQLPYILNLCGHSICKTCLISVFKNKQVKCFVCKQINVAEDLQSFTKNLALLQLIPLTQYGQQNSSKPIHKKEFDSVSSIEDCVSSFKTEQLDIIAARKVEQSFCNNHNKLIEAFCWNDKLGLCIDCLLGQQLHKNHQVLNLEQANLKQQDLFNKQNEKLKQMITKLNITQKHLQSKKIDINTMEKEKQESLKRFYQEVRQFIDMKEKELSQELEQELKMKNEKLKENLENTDKIQNEIKIYNYSNSEKSKQKSESKDCYKQIKELVQNEQHAKSIISSIQNIVKSDVELIKEFDISKEIRNLTTQIQNLKQIFNKKQHLDHSRLSNQNRTSAKRQQSATRVETQRDKSVQKSKLNEKRGSVATNQQQLAQSKLRSSKIEQEIQIKDQLKEKQLNQNNTQSQSLRNKSNMRTNNSQLEQNKVISLSQSNEVPESPILKKPKKIEEQNSYLKRSSMQLQLNQLKQKIDQTNTSIPQSRYSCPQESIKLRLNDCQNQNKESIITTPLTNTTNYESPIQSTKYTQRKTIDFREKRDSIKKEKRKSLVRQHEESEWNQKQQIEIQNIATQAKQMENQQIQIGNLKGKLTERGNAQNQNGRNLVDNKQITSIQIQSPQNSTLSELDMRRIVLQTKDTKKMNKKNQYLQGAKQSFDNNKNVLNEQLKQFGLDKQVNIDIIRNNYHLHQLTKDKSKFLVIGGFCKQAFCKKVLELDINNSQITESNLQDLPVEIKRIKCLNSSDDSYFFISGTNNQDEMCIYYSKANQQWKQLQVDKEVRRFKEINMQYDNGKLKLNQYDNDFKYVYEIQ